MPNTYTDVTDIHVHIQPWRQILPHVLEILKAGRTDMDLLARCMDDPAEFLHMMDKAGLVRAGLINYVAPDTMGFTDESNLWCARYAQAAPDRLIPFGSVHPRFSKDPAGDVARLRDLGIRALKVHPPHQGFAPNAYLNGLEALAAIYRRAEEVGLPVMIHTGTSIFPGARSRLGDPMAVDDVALDFPRLTIVMAHGGRPLWMDAAQFLVRRHPNVHMDVSSVPPQRLLQYFPRLVEISDKVLWGSDWPGPGVRSLGKNLEVFKSSAMPLAAKRAILSANARRIWP